MKEFAILFGQHCAHLQPGLQTALAQKDLSPDFVRVNFVRYSNGCKFLDYGDSVRGKNVFIIQTQYEDADENLMELWRMIHAVMSGGAGMITVIMPSLIYARSDNRKKKHTPITLHFVAETLNNWSDKVMVIDPHSQAAYSVFRKPDVLASFSAQARRVQEEIGLNENLLIGSPDSNTFRPQKLLERLGRDSSDPLFCIKNRPDHSGRSTIGRISHDVEGKRIVFIDDEWGSGGTIFNAIDACEERGCEEVNVFISHFYGDQRSVDKLMTRRTVRKLWINNGVPVNVSHPQIGVINVEPLIANYIEVVQRKKELSPLLQECGQ